MAIQLNDLSTLADVWYAKRYRLSDGRLIIQTGTLNAGAWLRVVFDESTQRDSGRLSYDSNLGIQKEIGMPRVDDESNAQKNSVR